MQTKKGALGRGLGLGFVAYLAGLGLALYGALFFVVPSVAGFAFGIFFMVGGVLSLLFGFGYQKARRWAWALGIAAGVVYVAVGVLIAPVIPLAGSAFLIYGTLIVSFMDRKEVRERLGVLSTR